MINFKKFGALVKVEITDHGDRYVPASAIKFPFMPGGGTSYVMVDIDGELFTVPSISDLGFDGEAAADQADFESKLPTVFPDANGSTGGSAQFSDEEATTLRQIIQSFTT